jgi:site-specific recombinase XerD
MFRSVFASVKKMIIIFPVIPMGPIQRLGIAAKLPFAIHPHVLRHACGE